MIKANTNLLCYRLSWIPCHTFHVLYIVYYNVITLSYSLHSKPTYTSRYGVFAHSFFFVCFFLYLTEFLCYPCVLHSLQVLVTRKVLWFEQRQGSCTVNWTSMLPSMYVLGMCKLMTLGNELGGNQRFINVDSILISSCSVLEYYYVNIVTYVDGAWLGNQKSLNSWSSWLQLISGSSSLGSAYM